MDSSVVGATKGVEATGAGGVDHRRQFSDHCNRFRFPDRYTKFGSVEDFVLHQNLLVEAKNPENHPVFHVQALEDFLMEGSAYEVTFATLQKADLLTQLSAMFVGKNLQICETHLFSTTDGYALIVFVVVGWPAGETEQNIRDQVESVVFESKETDQKLSDEVKSTVSGSKISSPSSDSPPKPVVTDRSEYEHMVGWSLYDYLRKKGPVSELPILLKFAVDVSRGMESLHGENIFHRALNLKNLLLDANNVVKVTNFSDSRFHNPDGVVLHGVILNLDGLEQNMEQPLDQREDIFSFAVVLWELVTGKVEHTSKDVYQSVLPESKGYRPDILQNLHPSLLALMQRCMAAAPDARPSFSEIRDELEQLLTTLQE